MSRSNLQIALGAALMAWGGASITAALGFTGWKQVNVALFAVGIILLAGAPHLAFESRIRRLEKSQRPTDRDSVTPHG